PTRPEHPRRMGGRVIAGRLALVAACVLATGAALRVAAASDLAPSARLDRLPLVIDGWRGADDAPLDADAAREVNSDAYVLRDYARGAEQLGLYVAYYATQRSGRTIHSPLNCLPGTGWEWLERGQRTVAVPGGATIAVNRALAQRDAD